MLSLDELYELAVKAREKSYSPYSNFKVGAVIEMKDGTVILGANIENAAYPLCICAERCAIFQCVVKGYTQKDYAQMMVIADTPAPCSPCGSCRQVLHELYSHEAPIYLTNMKKEIYKTNVEELLPGGFVKEDMGR